MDSQSADAPGVVVWPPLLYTSALLVGVGLHFVVPLAALPRGPCRLAGTLVLAGGLALGGWGERTMHSAGTNLHPSNRRWSWSTPACSASAETHSLSDSRSCTPGWHC